MSFERQGPTPLDYFSCHYGKSKAIFRGPRASLDRPYCALLGGSEFYGKFVERPVNVVLSEKTRNNFVNFGQMNCGLDTLIYDTALHDIINAAGLTLLQVLPAHTLSNRFYKVHPRRNDRFLKPTEMLRALYPHVDFTDFHFARHMLLTLQRISPEKFLLVVDELRAVWVARMRLLLKKIKNPTIVVHISDSSPDVLDNGLGEAPLFVDNEMVKSVSQEACDLVHYDMSETRYNTGVTGMRYALSEAQMAAELMPPACHEELAEALLPKLTNIR